MHLSLRTWEVRLGIILVASSVVIYVVKDLLLGDPQNTYQYIFNALGFLPINVLLVTLILNQLLSIRAKRERLEKMNMVIGAFFSEVGSGLLTSLGTRQRSRGDKAGAHRNGGLDAGEVLARARPSSQPSLQPFRRGRES